MGCSATVPSSSSTRTVQALSRAPAGAAEGGALSAAGTGLAGSTWGCPSPALCATHISGITNSSAPASSPASSGVRSPCQKPISCNLYPLLLHFRRLLPASTPVILHFLFYFVH